MEEDDEILDINIDPFSEEWVRPFEEQDENKAAEGQNKEQDKGLSRDEAKEETNHCILGTFLFQPVLIAGNHLKILYLNH